MKTIKLILFLQDLSFLLRKFVKYGVLDYSVLRKQKISKTPLEFPESELSYIRQEEIKSNLKLMSKDQRTKELLEDQDDYSEVTSETIEKMIKKLEEKLKEYIIDEHEIEEIGECVKVLLDSEKLHFHDRLEIVYKYTRLYFKDYDKQDIILEKCNQGEEEFDGHIDEENDPNKHKYCQIMHYLNE